MDETPTIRDYEEEQDRRYQAALIEWAARHWNIPAALIAEVRVDIDADMGWSEWTPGEGLEFDVIAVLNPPSAKVAKVARCASDPAGFIRQLVNIAAEQAARHA